jgi:hypothetical protein
MVREGIVIAPLAQLLPTSAGKREKKHFQQKLQTSALAKMRKKMWISGAG